MCAMYLGSTKKKQKYIANHLIPCREATYELVNSTVAHKDMPSNCLSSSHVYTLAETLGDGVTEVQLTNARL